MAARRPDFPLSAPEQARILRIGAEGDGVALLPDGRPLYVPFTLPGETVLARRVGRRGDGVAAIAEAIAEPSGERVTPPCAQFGTCGGCAMQHWHEAPYRAWKSGLLAAALRRAGYDATPTPIATTPVGSRRRMDFAARREGCSVLLGLHQARGRDVVDIRACPVLHPVLAALLDPLRALLATLAGLRREAAVIVNLLDSGPDLLLRTDAALTAGDRARLAEFARAQGLARIAWAQDGDPPEIAAQLRPARVIFAGVAVAPPPGVFLQASAEGEAAIIAAALAGLPERLSSRTRVVELFAGCGTLTFPLATRTRVVAFDGDADAIAALSAAAGRAGLAGRVTSCHRNLQRQPLSSRELQSFAAVVLDPPHAGAAAQVAQIAASGVARVIYVSCNPASLARDASMLRTAGYRLLSAQPIDQFLWSARLESVAVFAR